MRFLVLIVLMFGCGAPIQSLSSDSVEKPRGFQYCANANVKWGKHVHKVYVCTPSADLCKKGVKDAKGAAGRLIGIQSVTDCKQVLY